MVRCAGGTCNCGVLVRSGDDVMRIDKCKWVNKTSSAYPINEQLFTNGELTPRTQIFQEKDGKQFQVGYISWSGPCCLAAMHVFT